MSRERRRKPRPDPRDAAAAYEAFPSLTTWNALMAALNVRADHDPPYRNGRDRNPTATTAVARVDRERKSS